MSISPESGQYPKVELLGMNQRAGQSQSPTETLALISTFPYLKANVPSVCNLADLIGGRSSSGVPVLKHPLFHEAVHLNL